jgi:hypothetical protein
MGTSDLSSANPTLVDSVLAQVTCAWGDAEAGTPEGQTTAAVLHSAQGVLVLEATDPRAVLPAPGTPLHVVSDTRRFAGRLAEHGRGGRFLVSVGDRPVRRSSRLKVSLPATLRSSALAGTQLVEIVDLTTSGARIRGVELPVGAQVTVGFTPPYRDEPVNVRAVVVHGTHRGQRPWIGIRFRLVAIRGGRQPD